MKILIFTAFLVPSIYVALFTLAVSPANAETIGIAITQNTYDLEILPGDSYAGQITVFNQSESLPLPVNLKLDLWNLREDSDDIEFVFTEDALNATRWFDLGGPTSYLLGAKDTAEEDRQVNFTISVPSETPPSSYFVIMRFEAVIPPHYYIESGPRANPEISALFFIRVPNLNLDGAISDYDAEIAELAPKGVESIDFLARIFPNAEAGVFEDAVKEMLARVRNTGIYHFTAKGTITIHNMFGAEVARGELPRKIMMPNRIRSMDILAESTGGFLSRHFNLGPYTATMVLEVPGNGEPIVETIHFWAFPWKVLSATTFILLLVIIIRRRIFGAMKALVYRKMPND
ncbi:MAG: hypothetical protein A2919_01410 [Candidatus Spechtbacteria bacterium RIFCSPLOWO2_01_FULL_43_12]|uniref:DUF916 domain-containing protein n=1 Tax=Candidatus Spechtbacteria bacterium RIFCSPLOWO2_01_FULL_43_12 TaxID=1802162 RepID=A0A1G2HG71_9BACT|nr:MAG: hypothetical protein A2919_01410 [Candidatus Spechtbacteria bacterium RIFCSPLOWO2_01_FULL_43_12]